MLRNFTQSFRYICFMSQTVVIIVAYASFVKERDDDNDDYDYDYDER